VTPDNRYHLAYLSAPDDFVRYAYSDDAGASLGPGAAGGLRIYGRGTP
jgi:hypothetical protein